MQIRKDIKKAILAWLFGQSSLESLCRHDPHDLVSAGIAARLEAHLLWRLGQLLESTSDYPDEIQEIRALLQRRCVFNAANNLRMDMEVRNLCRQLEVAGIKVMLLKGSALRARYSELAGRPQCDTDILIERDHLERAEAILAQAGFRVDEKSFTREEYLTQHFDLRMIRDDHPVELHWAISNEGKEGATERSWERAEPIKWRGVSVWIPALEDGVVFSSVHISRHLFWGSLRWFGDLVMELERGNDISSGWAEIAMDWPPRMAGVPFIILKELGYSVPGSIGTPSAVSPMDRFLLQKICLAAVWNEDGLWLPSNLWGYALAKWLKFEKSSLPKELVQVLVLGSLGKKITPWAK
jgi:hypothetical protein